MPGALWLGQLDEAAPHWLQLNEVLLVVLVAGGPGSAVAAVLAVLVAAVLFVAVAVALVAVLAVAGGARGIEKQGGGPARFALLSAQALQKPRPLPNPAASRQHRRGQLGH